MIYKVLVTKDAENDLDRFIRYFMMYRLEGDTAVIDNIFHELQDYEKKMK